MTMETVLKEALALSPQERAMLADELWRSVPTDELSLALTPAQRKDLLRRVAEDEAEGSDPQDWSTVRTKFRGHG